MGERPRVMSVLNLRPRKLGSFEEYTIALSRALTERGGQSILVFKDSPPEALRPQYTDAGAVLETKPFEPFGREALVLCSLLSGGIDLRRFIFTSSTC